MNNALTNTWSVFEPKTKRKFYVLVITMIGGSLIEAAGIGAVFPLLESMFLADGEVPSKVTAFILSLSGRIYPDNSFSALCVLVFFIIAIKNLYLVFMLKFQLNFVWGNRAVLSSRLFEHYISNPYTFHLERNSADLLRNVTSGVGQVMSRMVMPALTITTEIFVVIATAILLSFLAPGETLIAMIALGSITGFYYFLVQRPLRVWAAKSFDASAGYLFWVNQGLGGIKEAKTMCCESFFSDSFSRTILEHSIYQQRISLVSQIPRYATETVLVAGIILAILLFLPEENKATDLLPVIGLFGMSLFRLLPSFNRITASLGIIRDGVPAINQIFADVRDAKQFQSNNIQNPSITLNFKKRIVFENVAFKYDGTDLTALEDINLTISRGQSVGIVGPSGAGKTTLVDILLGLHSPTSGNIFVDDISIFSSMQSWRGLIGYIPQNIFLTDDSLRRNIAFGISDDKIDEVRVRQAAEQARLKDFISSLPDGLETVVGERGVRLSGGQKQRVGIARTLYRKASILVLDEATSALDSETEAEISAALDDLRGERTLIILAHRLSTVKQCDIIYFMDQGRIVDSGSFGDLARHNPKFKQMVELMSVTSQD